jgi:hypothetical protein
MSEAEETTLITPPPPDRWDESEEELEESAPAPPPDTPDSTLLITLLIGLGFLGGVLAQKHFGSSGSTSSTRRSRSRPPLPPRSRDRQGLGRADLPRRFDHGARQRRRFGSSRGDDDQHRRRAGRRRHRHGTVEHGFEQDPEDEAGRHDKVSHRSERPQGSSSRSSLHAVRGSWSPAQGRGSALHRQERQPQRALTGGAKRQQALVPGAKKIVACVGKNAGANASGSQFIVTLDAGRYLTQIPRGYSGSYDLTAPKRTTSKEFVDCMREHGVTVTDPSQINLSDPTVQAALQACRQYLPPRP